MITTGQKNALPPGPWMNEPDRVEFRHDGLPCLLKRTPFGAWCGYVGVPPGHPWHGRDYNDVSADVHGGLTYSRKCDESIGICHVPEPGEPEDVYWLGFDCAHSCDLVPDSYKMSGEIRAKSFRLYDDDDDDADVGYSGTYRDLAFVRAETVKLAEQASSSASQTAR